MQQRDKGQEEGQNVTRLGMSGIQERDETEDVEEAVEEDGNGRGMDTLRLYQVWSFGDTRDGGLTRGMADREL